MNIEDKIQQLERDAERWAGNDAQSLMVRALAIICRLLMWIYMEMPSK